MKCLSLAALAVMATFAIGAQQSQAATVPAVDLVSLPSLSVDGTGFAIGYRFLVNEDVDVVALGAYDYLGDGIVGGADVGLFTLEGAALATTNIAAGGLTGTLIGAFRYVDIAAVRLLAGVQYVLGSYSDDQHGFFNANYGGVVLDADDRVTLLRNRDLPFVDSLVFPSREPRNTHLGSFGPNMLIATPAAVPLPATLPLLLVALGAGGLVARRRRG